MPESSDDKKFLLSMNQAIKHRADRLRKPIWANKMDHFKIDFLRHGRVGSWIHFYSPFNKECNGHDPQDLFFPEWCPDMDVKEFEIYEGPLPGSNEYQEEVKQYEGILKRD